MARTFVGLLLVAAAVRAAPKVVPPAGPNVVIIGSGSTNAAGFQIEVLRSGVAVMSTVQGPGERATASPKRVQLPAAMVRRLYEDLGVAMPLAALPAVHCMKSASFGTSMTIHWGKEQTPDLNCGAGGNRVMGNLIRDVQKILPLMRK